VRRTVGTKLFTLISGGLCDLGAGFDGRLGTIIVLHAGEKGGVVFVATGLLDRVSGGCYPCFCEQRIVIFVAIAGVRLMNAVFW
jgi:hypothetical protein